MHSTSQLAVIFEGEKLIRNNAEQEIENSNRKEEHTTGHKLRIKNKKSAEKNPPNVQKVDGGNRTMDKVV